MFSHQSPKEIWIVDAFSSKPYAGNPAAVMIVDEFPADMAQIAAEMNLSETVFIKQLAQNHFHIRWLTPTVEVKLCGHGTLAAAHILFQENLIQGHKIIFESLSGPLEVSRENECPNSQLILNFPLQTVAENLAPPIYTEALGLNAPEIIEVVKAYDDVIVVLQDPMTLENLNPNMTKISAITDALSLIVTAEGGLHKDASYSYSQYNFVSRVFAPRDGIDEDPVTGSAHCKLADYWMKKLNKTEFFAYQASQRGGEIYIQVQGERVFLKGKAITMMAGKWLV